MRAWWALLAVTLGGCWTLKPGTDLPDVPTSDAAQCLPACPSGQVCVAGACFVRATDGGTMDVSMPPDVVAGDAGDSGALDTPVPSDSMTTDTVDASPMLVDASTDAAPDLPAAGDVATDMGADVPSARDVTDVAVASDLPPVVDTGTDAGVSAPDVSTGAGLTCVTGVTPVVCTSSENCCVIIGGEGVGCGFSPIPGFVPCVPP